jgi:hypothetical protein
MMKICNRFETEGLLRVEQGLPLDEHFTTCADCLAAQASYERLRHEVGSLGEGEEPPAGWQARVWERIEERRESRRRWWPWWLVPTAVAASLALFLLVRTPSPPVAVSLLAEVQAGSVVRRGDDAQPGDVLHLTATLGSAPHVELRVYRNDREVVLRCSDASPCVRRGAELRATIPLDGVGRYQPLLLLSPRALPPPAFTLDGDAAAALAAGAEVELGPEIVVR